MIPSKITDEKWERPSTRELWKKLTEVTGLIHANKWLPGDAVGLQADLDELATTFGLETTLREDLITIFVSALREITPADYAGQHPPKRSYKEQTFNLELFAFRWKSSFFSGREMYIKFCMTSLADKDRRAFIHSIHPHRTGEDAN